MNRPAKAWGTCYGCGGRYAINPAADVLRAHRSAKTGRPCAGSWHRPRRGTIRDTRT